MENEDKKGNRPIPPKIMSTLAFSESAVKEILDSKNASLEFTVDYEGEGENHGWSQAAHYNDITFFRLHISWRNNQPMEIIVATMLHEFGLHIAPAWERHKAAMKEGALSEDTFPDLKDEKFKAKEAKDHLDLTHWVNVVKNAMKYYKNSPLVLVEVYRDMQNYLEHDKLLPVMKV